MANPQTQAQPSVYDTALGKLQPLVSIFAGFNHRNKNQHRHAVWWAAFNSLRRNVGRLIGELEVAAAQSSKSGRKRKLDGKGKGKGRDDGEGGAVEKRARWVRDYAVPEAYLVFSQLAADNQFAVLGIVLVGVLASVHGACVHLVGDAESPTAAEAEVKRAVPVIAESAAAGRREEGTTTKSSSRHPGLGIVEEAVDLGQVVSREEVAAAVAARTHDEPGEQPLKRKKGEEVDQPAAKKKISTEGTKVTTGQRIEKPGKIAAEKKKKKKKSKGDEFDSLFSSLM